MSDPVDVVRLQAAEIRIAEWVGRQRHASAAREGCRVKWGYSHASPGAEETDKRGALAELAVGLALGLAWRPNVGIYRRPDLIGGVEVRSVQEKGYRLRILDDDADDVPFVLARVMPDQRIEVLGWMLAGEAKVPWRLRDSADRPPAYYVPADELRRDLDALRELANETWRRNR